MSEFVLGTVLFAIPLGSILSSFAAPWFVERFGSRRVLTLGILLYSALLIAVGMAETLPSLVFALFIFGLSSNLVNVSVNTQALDLERVMNRSVMASLHGLWSLAGFAGAALGTLMIAFKIHPAQHFSLVFLFVVVILINAQKYLLPDGPRSMEKQPFFVLPNRALIGLGGIAFLSMIAEGAMFDWSGVYFQNVIKAEPAWVGAGYAAFMSAMASVRFLADRLADRFGIDSLLKVSGLFIALGLTLSIISPSISSGIIGFLLVGAGTSSVVPLVMSQAGKASSYSPGVAIAAVSTIGFFGFLLGPPLIGWIAGISSLRVSFGLVAVLGLGISGLSHRQFAAKKV